MPEKILYYLGAGASAKALPLAKDRAATNSTPPISGLASDLADIIKHQKFDTISRAYIEQWQDVKRRCTQLSEKAKEFGDVDTYAKYLHIQNPGSNELNQLKLTLSQYFGIKQLLLEARDNRYLPWLVGIMNNKVFPENVKILSWNYDFQVELAAEQFGNAENIVYSANNSEFTYSVPLLLSYPSLDPSFSAHDKLSLIHLNGVAGFANEGWGAFSVFQAIYRGAISEAIALLGNMNSNTVLHFAWEKSNYHSRLMEHVKEMVRNTTILVVIGYSFPFFNREIDKEVFKALKNCTNFHKIYFQDPVLNGQQLRAQFDLGDNINIQHIQQTDNFHIPFEY